MDSEKINELLKKYWNCETTLEEEQVLRNYFKNRAPENLKETASLFQYFQEEKSKHIAGSSFESEVMNKVQRPAQGKIRSLVYNSMRIAAGIVVLVLAVWLVRMEVRESTPAEMVDTYDDPQLAFEETKKALMMISRTFSTAEEQAKKINLFNEAQKNIQKQDASQEL